MPMQTFPETLHHHVTHTPDRVAVTLLYSREPDQPITYRQLMDGAGRYAAMFGQAGIRPGEVVVLILDHGPELIFAFFGAVLHGAIPSILPYLTEKLDPEHYRKSLAALFDLTAPAAVLTAPAFAAEVDAARGERARPEILLTQLLKVEGSKLKVEPSTFNLQPSTIQPSSIVLLQHSSGTTGLQKGVALSHEAVFYQLESYRKAIRLTDEDVIVSWLPLYHDMGLIAGFLMPILLGVPLVLMSPFDWVRAPARLLQAVSQYRGTLTWLPNFAYNFCAQKIRERQLEGVDLSSWRAVINCSEPMHVESHRMFAEKFAPFGLRASALGTCYAMAENVFAVTQGGIDAPPTEDVIGLEEFVGKRLARAVPEGGSALTMLSAGRPLENVEVRVLGDDRNPLPERVIGELALRSNCMLTGYYHRPDATAQAFHEGWYLTGDLGYLADGEVYITGRKKDLIIVGGKNVYPQDLEYVANEVPGVYPGRVVAFGVYDEQAGTEEVVLVAETDATDEAARQRIADDIRVRVTKGTAVALRLVELVPREWLIKTSSGKIARGANRERYLKWVQS
ncbi:MAG TPA: fatty acyl-AMP ligase [Anaerolineales bacterium]|nr:fatty acyl-AMP ligase [Anaerolineales bacterium]